MVFSKRTTERLQVLFRRLKHHDGGTSTFRIIVSED